MTERFTARDMHSMLAFGLYTFDKSIAGDARPRHAANGTITTTSSIAACASCAGVGTAAS